MAINFDKYATEGNEFLNRLANEFGHPEEKARAGIALRAILRVLRDSLSTGENLNIISQLPMALKALYVDQWSLREKPKRLKTIEDFVQEVEHEQFQMGEREFNWSLSTEDIVRKTISCLRKYISDGEMNDIVAELSTELKPLFSEHVKI